VFVSENGAKIPMNVTAGPKVLDFSRFENVAVFFSVFFLISFLTRLIPDCLRPLSDTHFESNEPCRSRCVDAVVGEREKPSTSYFSTFSNRPNFDMFAAAATQ
jgi:hypothetical protein